MRTSASMPAKPRRSIVGDTFSFDLMLAGGGLILLLLYLLL